MSQLPAVAKIIWAAGVLDGEGCIYVAKNNAYQNYSLMVRVCMSDESTIRRLYSIFKVGSVYSYQPKKKNRKQMWNWACSSIEAKNVLAALLPYLWTKKKQALVAIAFQKCKSNLKRGTLQSRSNMKTQHRFYTVLREMK
jgi:hypothetical protein